MKTLIVSLTLLLSNFAFAANFSAFADGDKLHVTILTDTCNAYGVELVPNSLCHQDRLTRNYAVNCDAGLRVISTMMYCGEETKAQVFTLSLDQSKVAKEAKTLNIEYGQDVIEVELNR